MDDKGVRHAVDLHMQDLAFVSELHDHTRRIGLLVKSNQFRAALEHIQDRAGRLALRQLIFARLVAQRELAGSWRSTVRIVDATQELH